MHPTERDALYNLFFIGGFNNRTHPTTTLTTCHGTHDHEFLFTLRHRIR